MKNKKLEAILNTIKLRDENGKIYPISDELMLQYILNFLTQKPLEAIIVDRYDISKYGPVKEKIAKLNIYYYYISTIFDMYSDSTKRIEFNKNLSGPNHFMFDQLTEISKSSYTNDINIYKLIDVVKVYFLGEDYFSDIEQIVSDDGIMNSIIYHAIVAEYQHDESYLTFNPSEFDSKIRECRKVLSSTLLKELKNGMKSLKEEGEIISVPEG